MLTGKRIGLFREHGMQCGVNVGRQGNRRSVHGVIHCGDNGVVSDHAVSPGPAPGVILPSICRRRAADPPLLRTSRAGTGRFGALSIL